jgi:hypothetical protein
MSVFSLGQRARCGTLTCDTLVAKNDPAADPHLIEGDLEVTGDLKVDGDLNFTPASTNDGFVVNAPPGGSTSAEIILKTDTGTTWTIDADSAGPTLFINNKLAGAGSGEIVATFTRDGCSFVAEPEKFALESTSAPTTAAAVPSTHTYAIKINGSVYKLLLSDV